jgi:anaerobic ribonucleoside-triphosphate reductase activating protein
MSRDTWQRREDTAVPVEVVAARCIAWAEDGADGLTISGGEPFEQPEPLARLLNLMGSWRQRSGRSGFDILCYSGMKQSRLEREHGGVLAQLDALVPEPFQERRSGGARWRGSTNQPLLALSALGRARYTRLEPDQDGPNVQIALADDGLFFVGIPRRGDMDRIEAALKARGIRLEGASWRG